MLENEGGAFVNGSLGYNNPSSFVLFALEINEMSCCVSSVVGNPFVCPHGDGKYHTFFLVRHLCY